MIFGRIAARFGQLTTLKVVVAFWIVATVVVSKADSMTFPYVACVAAAMLGPVQAISRSLFRVLFPESAMSSFFGVQTFASRASSLVGPLLFGTVSYLSGGNQRFGVWSISFLFAGGLAMLYQVPADAERVKETAP